VPPLRDCPVCPGTLHPLPTEPLEITPLCLAGCLVDHNGATINLDLTAAQPAPGGGAAADFSAWPEFHNGVAAGTSNRDGVSYSACQAK
jgi:anaphase-promoting complex subunit 1